jgi:two-component system probable response regulator PhcQ
MYRLLLIDDEPGVLNALMRLLRHTPLMVGGQTHQTRVDACTEGSLALAKAASTAYDAVICDFRMPGMNGVEVLRRMRDLQPGAARLILSGYADLNGLVAAINEARIDRFLAKPWSDFDIIVTLSQVLEGRALRLENEALADRMRFADGRMTAVELEARRLELLEPGLTHVQWDADGSVVFADELDGAGRQLLS